MIHISAKALAGNLGAQLTVMRDKAEGKIIHIYFDMDNKFYEVTLSTFNPLDHTFKLIHHDGFDDSDSYALWTQTIRL